MKVTLAKFCDYACVVDGGKHALIGIFDTIGGHQYPLVHPTLYVCIELEFEPHEAHTQRHVHLVLIDEDGKEIIGVHGQIYVPPPQDARPVTMWHMFRFDGLRFERPGRYRLDILDGNQPIGESRLFLVQGPPPYWTPPPHGYPPEQPPSEPR